MNSKANNLVIKKILPDNTKTYPYCKYDYSYDALGRRTAKVVKDFEKLNEFSRKYLYNGQDILAELDESDNTLAVYTHSTLRMDDILSADIRSKKLANTEGSYFFLKDDLGSIVDISDASGVVVQHYSYSSFGRILAIKDGSGNDITGSPLVSQSFTYTGREFDSETGLYYYRARFYDPALGRFLTEDPHPGLTKLPGTFNSKYIYVLNNPILYTDPKGELAPLAIIAIAAIVGGITNAYINRENGSFAQNFLTGAAIGAISAGIGLGVGAGLSAAFGTGFWASVGAGAGAGAASSAASQYLTTGTVDGRLVIMGAVLGGIGGAVGHGLGASKPATQTPLQKTTEGIHNTNSNFFNNIMESSSEGESPQWIHNLID